MTPESEEKLNEVFSSLRSYGAKNMPSVNGLRQVFRQRLSATDQPWNQDIEDLWIAGYVEGLRMGAGVLNDVQRNPTAAAFAAYEEAKREGLVTPTGPTTARRPKQRTLGNLFGLLP